MKIRTSVLQVIYFIFFISALLSCGKKETPKGDTGNSFFAKGADVSWITQMESAGIPFKNSSGEKEDLFSILKSLGMNSIRLRVWVNPADGWCGTQDVLTKAIRAKNTGMKIMIDFHYSDSWADPGKQNKPAAWQNLGFDDLVNTVNSYTKDVLQTLKDQNIFPDWVQVGNETNDGMLWPDGRASVNMKNFAALVKSGYNAVKEVFPSSKVIVHLSNGYDNAMYRWMFDGLKNNGVSWDMIGMSLYPDSGNWQQLNDQCLANIKDMISRYSTPVMICETGMDVSEASDCKEFLTDLIRKVSSLPENSCSGVFYWEPECYNNWQGYTKGAFTDAGMPSVALDVFK